MKDDVKGPAVPGALRRRVGSALLGALAIGIIVVAAAGLLFLRVLGARDELLDRVDPAAVAAREFLSALVSQESGVRGYALTGDETFLEPYEKGRSEERDVQQHLAELVPDLPEVHAAVDALQARADEWHRDSAEAILAQVEVGGPEAVTEEALDESRAAFDRIRGASAELDAALSVRRTVERDRINTSTRSLVIVGGGAVVVLVIAGFVMWRLLRGWILAPLDRLGKDARHVTDGRLDHQIETNGPPELAELGRDVEAMRRRIVDDLTAAEAARSLLEHQAAELERSNAELEQFAYVASHDLQEPLRKVASFCQLLQQRYADQLDERANQYIDFAVDGAKRMQALIGDLLALSRVGRVTPAFVLVDTDTAVERAVVDLQLAIDESGATIRRRPLPDVEGDPSLLAALFQNVIGNAIKYRSDAAPLIEIAAERTDGTFEFHVSDNGIGIEEQFAEQVFLIFQRLHGRDAYAGTGIGLALCRKIVEFHGGRIWVDTTASSGTTVRWTLPVPATAGPGEPEEALLPADATW